MRITIVTATAQFVLKFYLFKGFYKDNRVMRFAPETHGGSMKMK